MKAEVKDLFTNHVESVFLVEYANDYLVEPYILESDSEGNFSRRYYTPYILPKELEEFEYVIYIQEER